MEALTEQVPAAWVVITGILMFGFGALYGRRTR
jgi:hypothetical protein